MTKHIHECDRCGGMKVAVYDDMGSPDDTGKDVIGWRCINCGDYVDELVLRNRETQREGARFPLRLAKERSPMHRVPPLSIVRRRAVV